MKPYSKQWLGQSEQTTTITATGAPYAHSVNHGVAWQRSLQCPTTVIKGNFTDANPWDYTVSEIDYLRGTMRTVNPSLTTVTRGFIGPPYSSHPDVGVATSEATKRAMDKLNEKVRGSLDLAVSIAEGRQTIRMLNLVDRYVSAIRHMRRSFLRQIWAGHRSRKHKRRLPRLLKKWQSGIKSQYGRYYEPVPVTPGLISRVSSAGANGWLEFTYGWKPLISDVRGVAENVLGSVRNYLMKFKAKGTYRISESTKVTGPNGHVGVCRVSGFASVQYGVQMKPGFDTGLSQWTSLNPLTVAYELVPLSFVFDWIIDLGGYMRNLETSLLYHGKYVKGYASTLWTYTSKTTFSSHTNPYPGYTSTLTGQCSYKATKFSRVFLPYYPLPQPPKIHPDLGSSRLLSAASLLRQALK